MTIDLDTIPKGVCYRPDDWSPEAYDEAIEDLKNAKLQMQSIQRGEYQPGCLVCGDSGHTANICDHNPLILARRYTAATEIYNCWHCGFVAHNDEEAREHFGRTEEEVARCITNSRIRALEAENVRRRDTQWRPMDCAPRDGTPIQAEIPGHGSDFVIAWTNDLFSQYGKGAGGWQIMTEQEPPDDWTDGVCWEVNEDGEPSTQPSRWKPLEGSPVIQHGYQLVPTEPSDAAIADVRAERQRQMQVEGWTAEHDDEHGDGQLAQAAAAYACHNVFPGYAERMWPWDEAWWKPTTDRRDMVKAAALLIAEIERLDRAALAEAKKP